MVEKVCTNHSGLENLTPGKQEAGEVSELEDQERSLERAKGTGTELNSRTLSIKRLSDLPSVGATTLSDLRSGTERKTGLLL